MNTAAATPSADDASSSDAVPQLPDSAFKAAAAGDVGAVDAWLNDGHNHALVDAHAVRGQSLLSTLLPTEPQTLSSLCLPAFSASCLSHSHGRRSALVWQQSPVQMASIG